MRITKAAYYKWLHHPVPQAEQESLVLAELIREYEEQYNHILDYRRMTAKYNASAALFEKRLAEIE